MKTIFLSTPRAIIRDFMKLPYAISGALERVAVVNDGEDGRHGRPDAILGVVDLGGETRNQNFWTPILDQRRVRRELIRDGRAIDGGLLDRFVVWEVGQLLVAAACCKSLDTTLSASLIIENDLKSVFNEFNYFPVRTLSV